MKEGFNLIPKKTRPVIYSLATTAALLSIACSGGKDSTSESLALTQEIVASPTQSIAIPTQFPTSAPTFEPTVEISRTPQDVLRRFVQKVLNESHQAFIPNQFNLQEKPGKGELGIELTQEVIAGSGEKITFLFGYNKESQEAGQTILIVKDGYQNDDLDSVFEAFGRYFKMQEVGKEKFKKLFSYDTRDNFVVNVYEAIIDNPDGSKETRSAYTTKSKNLSGSVTIAVGACKILPSSPYFEKNTCIGSSQ